MANITLACIVYSGRPRSIVINTRWALREHRHTHYGVWDDDPYLRVYKTPCIYRHRQNVWAIAPGKRIVRCLTFETTRQLHSTEIDLDDLPF